MTKEQEAELVKVRHSVQTTNQNWHTYPIVEEALHTLNITQETMDINTYVAVTPTGMLCFCEPDVEDYTEVGRGMLIMHRQVCWQ